METISNEIIEIIKNLNAKGLSLSAISTATNLDIPDIRKILSGIYKEINVYDELKRSITTYETMILDYSLLIQELQSSKGKDASRFKKIEKLMEKKGKIQELKVKLLLDLSKMPSPQQSSIVQNTLVDYSNLNKPTAFQQDMPSMNTFKILALLMQLGYNANSCLKIKRRHRKLLLSIVNCSNDELTQILNTLNQKQKLTPVGKVETNLYKTWKRLNKQR